MTATQDAVLPEWAQQYVLADETVIHADRPKVELFLSRILVDVAVALVLVIVAWKANAGWVGWIAVVGMILIACDCFVQYKFWQRTLYVLTDRRAMRFQGWLNQDFEWLSWGKVTEVTVRKSWGDLIFRIATIEIHTAHSASSFRAMRDVGNPEEFVQKITTFALARGNRD